MHKPGFVALVVLLAGIVAPASQARTVSGIDVAEQVNVGGQRLQLNGAGMREKYFFDIYVCALYLPKPAHTAATALAEGGPRRVLMHFVYHRVGRDKLVDGWNEGFEANTSESERSALQKRINDFNALFGDAPRGQVVLLDYLPGKGTAVSIDGRLRGTIPGKDFNDALMRIWLGEHPVTSALKRGLLGQ